MSLLENKTELKAFDGTEQFYILNGTDDNRGTLNNVGQQMQWSRWGVIDTSKYTATPTTTSRILMSDTTDFFVGAPARYKYSGTTYYGMVTGISANTHIDIAGATLSASVALTELAVGAPEMLIQKDYYISGAYDTTEADILALRGNQYDRWTLGPAYLVMYEATHKTADGGTEPKINVKVDGSAVGTDDSNNGIQMSGTAGTWVRSGAVAISTSNYKADRGSGGGNEVDLEITVTVDGGTPGTASDLSVHTVWVLE